MHRKKKVVLGWNMNTILFKIFLPMTKAIDWIQTIKVELNKNKIKVTNLESLIGKLHHAGYIFPQSRYFLNRLRHLLERCQKYGPQLIPDSAQADLLL